MNKIIFKPDEEWMLLLSMLRYSLGRHSYIVGWCVEIIQRNWHNLCKAQQTQIQRETAEHFRMFPPKENCIDYRYWEKLLNMEVKIEER